MEEIKAGMIFMFFLIDNQNSMDWVKEFLLVIFNLADPLWCSVWNFESCLKFIGLSFSFYQNLCIGSNARFQNHVKFSSFGRKIIQQQVCRIHETQLCFVFHHHQNNCNTTTSRTQRLNTHISTLTKTWINHMYKISGLNNSDFFGWFFKEEGWRLELCKKYLVWQEITW